MKLLIFFCHLVSAVAFTQSTLFQQPAIATTLAKGKTVVQRSRGESTTSLKMMEVVDSLLPTLIFASTMAASIAEDKKTRDGKLPWEAKVETLRLEIENSPSTSEPEVEPTLDLSFAPVEEVSVPLDGISAEKKLQNQKNRYKMEAEQMKKAAAEAKAEHYEKEAKAAREAAARKQQVDKTEQRPLVLRSLSLFWRILQKIIAPWRKWAAIA